MRIILDARKTVEENAALYFEKGKKARKKADGARKALEKTRERLEKKAAQKQRAPVTRQQKEHWYEKFRWFVSSEGFLCVGGRDASSNEALVKKHMGDDDVVFHTDMAGSPFTLVKTEGKAPGDATLSEAAIFTASYSRAWREGLATLDVFYVKPEQVSKTAESGEFMGKGAFMIRGKTTYVHPRLGLLLGKSAVHGLMIGPKDAVLVHCPLGYELFQGKDKTSDVAKKLGKLLESHPDDIVPLLPAGGLKVGKRLQQNDSRNE